MMQQLKIGTRASPLALKQAEMVKAALAPLLPGVHITIHPMTTRGDKAQGRPLSDWGLKGLFTKELQDAMQDSAIDIAVHSVKDMPSILPDGLTLAATLPRDDARDAWISPKYPDFLSLPQGAVIGTASLRRTAQALQHHPFAQIKSLRGNVQTRLQKIQDGVADGTFLSCAGLDRLGLQNVINMRINRQVMLPAVAQGTIGIECKKNASALRDILAQLNCAHTFCAITAERAMLKTLDGSCKTPIAGYAYIENNILHMQAQIIAPDGSAIIEASKTSSPKDAELLGNDLGSQLKSRAPISWLKEAI